MKQYEILFEANFDQVLLNDNPSRDVEGFFALRQIHGHSLPAAVEIGIGTIKKELAAHDPVLGSALDEIAPAESRALSDFRGPHTSGFAFF